MTSPTEKELWRIKDIQSLTNIQQILEYYYTNWKTANNERLILSTRSLLAKLGRTLIKNLT